MNEVLKQRLVGALILVALGVVFWPIIFVQPGSEPDGERYSMPPSPRVNVDPVPPPDRAGLRSSAELKHRPPEPAPNEEKPEAGTAPEPIEPAPPVAPVEDLAREKQPPEAATEPLTASERLRSEAPVKPEIDADGVPVAWMLQVASVSSEQKAQELRDRLLAAGHKAYSRKIRRNGTILWRVYIGPKFEKAKLEAIREQVDSSVGVKSLVVRYYP